MSEDDVVELKCPFCHNTEVSIYTYDDSAQDCQCITCGAVVSYELFQELSEEYFSMREKLGIKD